MSALQILVVDDDARYAASVCELLRAHDFCVAQESDARRAVQRLQTDDIDVLLLDLNMPDVSGVDILRTLSARTGGPKTIIVSGTSQVDRIAPVVRLGAFDYLAKPVEPAQLVDRVSCALACIRRERESRAANAQRQAVLLQEGRGEAAARLATDVAHDLNNILTSVIGYTELSLDASFAPDGAQARHYQREVLAAGQRARDLISQILLLTRSGAGDVACQAAPLPTGRIVIVDHEAAVANCIAQVLRDTGFAVVVFDDSAAALDFIAAHCGDIALVLVDQRMPQWPGSELADGVQGSGKAPPILIMTGYADRTDAQRSDVRILNKPFRVDELLDAVRTIAIDQ